MLHFTATFSVSLFTAGAKLTSSKESLSEEDRRRIQCLQYEEKIHMQQCMHVLREFLIEIERISEIGISHFRPHLCCMHMSGGAHFE